MKQAWLPAAFVAAAISYSTWLLGPVLNPAIDPIATVASELAATDQPYSWFFRGGDVAAGILAIAAGGYLCLVSRGWVRIPWAGSVVFGIATVLDSGVTPMTCAVSLNPGCALSGGGLGQELADPHVWTSSFAAGGALVSVLSLAWSLQRRASRFTFAGYAIAAATATASLLSAAQLLGEGHTGGAWQRAQLVAVAAWLLLSAIAVRWKQ